MKKVTDRITVFYDGACPRCVRDRKQYEKWSGDRKQEVCWFDITGQEAALREQGIDPQLALTELHVRASDGSVHSELDAYILLMERVPRLRILAWLIGLPVIRPLLSRVYHRMVRRRLRRSGRL